MLCAHFCFCTPATCAPVACLWGAGGRRRARTSLPRGRRGGRAAAALSGAHPSRAFVQKHREPEARGSANSSSLSTRSAGAQASAPSQESVRTRLRSAAASSSRSLASLPSQESLVRLDASSPEDKAANTTLMSLPGYRPATRSSMRHSQFGAASTGERLWLRQDPAVLGLERAFWAGQGRASWPPLSPPAPLQQGRGVNTRSVGYASWIPAVDRRPLWGVGRTASDGGDFLDCLCISGLSRGRPKRVCSDTGPVRLSGACSQGRARGLQPGFNSGMGGWGGGWLKVFL